MDKIIYNGVELKQLPGVCSACYFHNTDCGAFSCLLDDGKSVIYVEANKEIDDKENVKMNGSIKYGGVELKQIEGKCANCYFSDCTCPSEEIKQITKDCVYDYKRNKIYIKSNNKENDMQVKLKYRLEKWEKHLVFQILEQDKRFSTKQKRSSFTAQNNFDVYSDVNKGPYLGDTFICLRENDKEFYLNVATRLFNSNKERDAYFDRLQEALKDWAANWEGWKEDKKTTEQGNGIFIL